MNLQIAMLMIHFCSLIFLQFANNKESSRNDAKNEIKSFNISDPEYIAVDEGNNSDCDIGSADLQKSIILNICKSITPKAKFHEKDERDAVKDDLIRIPVRNSTNLHIEM